MRAAFRRLEVSREREDGWIVEPRLAMKVAAGGEDEHGATDRCVQLVLADRYLLPRDVRKDD